MEGKSLVAALEGKAFERPALFWEHEGNRAVRLGDWKMVAGSGEKWQLYNIALDRAEMKNLAEENAATAAELKGLYEAWAKRCGVEDWPVRK